jgi:hypothetical protein
MTEKISRTTQRMVDLPEGMPLVRTRWDKGQIRPVRLVETLVEASEADGQPLTPVSYTVTLGGPMVTLKGAASSSRRGEAVFGAETGALPVDQLPEEIARRTLGEADLSILL